MRCLSQTVGSTKYKLQPSFILVSTEKKLPALFPRAPGCQLL